MSKSWSSFEGQQLLQENWRNFLSEESDTAAWLTDQGYETKDHWEEPEEQGGDPQASDYPDVSHGLDSKDNTDSLKQVLTPILDAPQIQTLIDVIAQIAGDEGIMLELSLKGLNSEQDRIIDSAGTALILKAIAGFNLPDTKNTALIKALNYWGRVNSVKFTAPPAAAPAVVNTTDPRDDTSQDTAPPDEPEPEPEQSGQNLVAEYPEAFDWWKSLPYDEQDRLQKLGERGMLRAWEEAGRPEPEPGTTAVSKDQQRRTPRIGRQIQGSGPADPDDATLPPPTEPTQTQDTPEEDDQDTPWYQPTTRKQAFEDNKGWNGHRWVDATPENAYKAALIEASPWSNNYKDQQKLIEDMKYLQEAGGGAAFQDSETSTTTVTPVWVGDPGSAAAQEREPGVEDRVIPTYHALFLVVTPSLLQRLKDFFKIDRRAYEYSEVKRLNKIPPAAKKVLDHMIKTMERQHEKSRKPEDDDPDLQETLDRWQTLSGINKRVL